MTKAKKRGLYALLIAMLASAAAAGAIMLMPVSAHTAGAETTSVATQAEGDVAQIGENTYATLQAAADSITDETPTTITLIADVTPEANTAALSVALNTTRNIIIELNGHDITTTGANEVFSFKGGSSGSLTIKGEGNVTAGGGSYIVNASTPTVGTYVYPSVEINIEGGTYTTMASDATNVFFGATDTFNGNKKSITAINISGGTFTSGNLTSLHCDSMTISGGTFNCRVGLYNDVTITGGTFDPSDDKITYSTAATTNIEISGGSFTCDVPATLIPEGTVFYEKNGVTAVGEEYIASAGAAAYVGSTAYATFNDAVAEATSGNTITLVADQTITTAIGIVEKNLVIDFNGFTLTGNVTSAEDGSPEVIGIRQSSDVQLKDGKIVVESEDTDAIFAGSSNVTLENITIEALATNNYGITFYGNMAAADALAALNNRADTQSLARSGDLSNFKTLTIKNSTISASAYAISGNAKGDADGTIINIENSKIYDNGNSSGWGIYHPQIGIVNINGENTEIKAATAIEMRGGELNITGGTFISTDKYSESPYGSGNGPTLGGVAIAVSQHTDINSTARPVIVNISDGTFEAQNATGKAIYEVDLVDDDSTGIEINITGGNYSGEVYSENITEFVTGGEFSAMPKADYFAEGYAAKWDDNKNAYVTGATSSIGSFVAEVNGASYVSLQEAIDAANAGDTVTLLGDVEVTTAHPEDSRVGIIINKSLTIDGNNHSLTNNCSSVWRFVWVRNDNPGLTRSEIENIKVIFENITITNAISVTSSPARAVETRSGDVDLTFINSTISTKTAPDGNTQVLTIGGKGDDINITIDNSKLIATSNGYALISFNPATIDITNSSELSGFAAIYMKGIDSSLGSAGSKITVTNSVLSSTGHSGETNDFGTIVFEDGNITLDIVDSTIKTSTEAEDAVQAAVLYSSYSESRDPNVVTITGTNIITSGDNATFANDSQGTCEIIVGIGSTVNMPISEKFLAEDTLLYSTSDGTYSVGTQEAAATAGMVAVIGQTAYPSLAAAVEAVPADNTPTTITLIGGESGVITAPGVKVQAGQNIIIDFNNLTYNVTDTVGSSGTETNGFQLLKGSTVTMKNGTIVSKTAKILIQNYCNLTVEDMTLDMTNCSQVQYVMSNNFGNTVITGNTTITAASGQVAFDVYYGLGTTYYDGVSVTFDENFTGTVTGKVEYGASNAGSQQEGWLGKTQLDIQNGNFDITLSVHASYSPLPADQAEQAAIEISGGKFEEKVDPAYLAEGLVFYEKDGIMNVGERNSVVDGTNYVVSFNGEAYATIDAAVADGMVARIGTYGYASLAEALAAAEAEDVVVLQTDTAIGTLILSDSFTLDLNGHTITSNILFVNGNPGSVITANISNGAINATTYGILVYNNVELNVSNVDIYGGDTGIYVPVTVNNITATKSTAVNVEGGSVRGGSAGSVLCGIGDSDATATSLVATDTLFAGGTFGITGNGTAHNTYIELNNCTVVGGDATPEDGITGDGVGIYHPQAGELVVNGGSVTGVSSGIEVRAGTVTINDADITATATEFSAVNNGNGTTITGAAIAVSQHTTNLPIDVTVNGGTISGVKAVYEVDLENDEATDLIVVTLNDGVYNGGVYSENCTQFVSGGQYQDELDDSYFAPGFDMQLNDDGMYEVVSVAKNLEAQADVRNFAATLGISWSQLEKDAEGEDPDGLATAAIEAYNAIYSAVGAEAISVARLDAMDAVAAYADQSNSELATAKKAAVEEIRQYAAESTGGTGEDNKVAVAVPTYIISAIYNATSEDEINEYVTLGKAEIDEIRSERAKAEEQFEEFNKQFEAIKDALGITGDSSSGYTSEVLTKLDGIISALKITESGGTWSTTLLDDITADIATANTNIQAIQNLLGTMADEDTAQTIIGLIKETQSKVTTAETNIKNAISDLSSKVEQEYEALNTAIGKLPTNDAVTELTTTVNQLKTDIGTMNTTVGNLNTSIGELKTSVDALTKAQETLTKAVEDYKAAVDKTLTDISGKFDTLSAKVDELPTNSELQTALDTALADIKTTLADIIADTAEIDGLATEIISGVDEKIKEAFATFKGQFDEAVKGINENIDAVQSVVDALPDDADMEALKSALEAAIDKATEAATAAGDKVDTLNTTLDGRLDTVDTALGDIEGAIDDLTAAQKELSGMVESYKTAVNSALTEINGKFDTLTELIEAIPTNDELSAALNSALSENLKDIIADIEQIKADTALIEDLDTTIVTKVSEKIDAAFAGFKTTFDEAIGTINGDLEAINNALALLPQGTDLAALKDEIAKATEAATAANTKIDELAGSLDSRLDSVNSSIASLRSTISSISAAQVALQATVNSYKTQLTEAVTTLTAAIEGVKADVNALSEAATADKLELLEKLTSLQTSADELEQAIAGLESGSGADLTAVVNQLNSLQTSLSDVSGVIDDISAGVDGTSSGLVGIYVCLGVIIALAAAILVVLIVKKRN